MFKNKNINVFVIKTEDREYGVNKLLEFFDINSLSGKRLALKANYNSADPFPASTHIDTLAAIVNGLKSSGASIIMGERSGMGVTGVVLRSMGVKDLSKKLGFDLIVLDDLGKDEWVFENKEGHHWSRGYLFPKLFKEADAVIQTCCLKTHRFGGHFTMSLKNSVGMIAKYDPVDGYNYMGELHSSRYQRQMIAEINTSYKPAFVIMDGIKAFSYNGPEAGKLIEPGILMGSIDRVALDAAGVAILRTYGTTPEISGGNIFQLEQIKRAVELGIGASGPDSIKIIPVNKEAEDICSDIERELLRDIPAKI